jgi:hypothetical protein
VRAAGVLAKGRMRPAGRMFNILKRNVTIFTLALEDATQSSLTNSLKFNTMYWVNNNALRGFKSLFNKSLTTHSSQTHDIVKSTSRALWSMRETKVGTRSAVVNVEVK